MQLRKKLKTSNPRPTIDHAMTETILLSVQEIALVLHFRIDVRVTVAEER
jgi:hypothetical protein